MNEERHSILVVDDARDTFELVKAMLPQEHYVVYPAGNGVEALDTVRLRPNLSLMLLDLSMPEMDGFEVLAALRGGELTGASVSWESNMTPEAMQQRMQAADKVLQSRAREIPVIVVSGRNQAPDVLEARKYGVAGYLTKPIEQAALLERVQAALN